MGAHGELRHPFVSWPKPKMIKKSKKSTFGACSMLPMLLPHHTLGGKIHYSPHFKCQISVFWAHLGTLPDLARQCQAFLAACGIQ